MVTNEPLESGLWNLVTGMYVVEHNCAWCMEYSVFVNNHEHGNDVESWDSTRRI